MADFAPTHPGEILLSEFLEPMGISQYRIAKAIDVPPRRINEIIHGRRGISADTALRLSRALGLSDMFFINMQAHYDAEVAREQLANELAYPTDCLSIAPALKGILAHPPTWCEWSANIMRSASRCFGSRQRCLVSCSSLRCLWLDGFSELV